MKKTAALFSLMLPLMLAARSNTELLHLSNTEIQKVGNNLTVGFNLQPEDFKIKTNNLIQFTPAIVSDNDTLRLDPLTIAGKNAWYYKIRNGADASSLIRAGKDKDIYYNRTVPFETWMNRSDVIMLTDTLSECNCNPAISGTVPIAALDFNLRFIPKFNYSVPVDNGPKIYDLSGRANIIFEVNKTNIKWSYANNYAELDSIMQSINAVKDNPDATVTGIYLTGYASPEGSYANNVRLAAGRTETVMNYVKSHSSFPAELFHTSSVPEDWQGLREWISDSNLPDKQAMIDFIDDNSIPIAQKNDRFRTKFPKDYNYLLKNVYPGLRHTDYKITYSIRQYADIEEIRKMLLTNPRYLGENEIFLYANSCDKNSEEFANAIETAAALFPTSQTANLNAANVAMSHDDWSKAEYYLSKSGDSPLAEYGRGIFYAKQGDYTKALPYFEKAEKAGITDASQSIAQIKKLVDFRGEVTFY